MPDKLLAHIAPLGREHISFNGDYVWPSEPLKQGLRPCKSRTPRSSMPLKVRFGTDSVMTADMALFDLVVVVSGSMRG